MSTKEIVGRVRNEKSGTIQLGKRGWYDQEKWQEQIKAKMLTPASRDNGIKADVVSLSNMIF